MPWPRRQATIHHETLKLLQVKFALQMESNCPVTKYKGKVASDQPRHLTH